MIIKVSTKEECEICDNFLTLLIQDERKYDNTIDEHFVVKDYFINMLNDQNILLLYKENDINIGYIFAKKQDNTYLIDGLYILEGYRNKQIATKLLKEIIKEIKDYKIYINVLKENKNALYLYRNNGFIINKEVKLKYSMVYFDYKLVGASTNDIERIKEYKLKSILPYANNIDDLEKIKINDYVNKTILININLYKNIIFDEKIIGSILITKEENLLLDEIYIEDEYQNKGIGTLVIKDILKKVDNLYLWVYKDNTNAVNLYKELGFKIKNTTDYRYYMEYKRI